MPTPKEVQKTQETKTLLPITLLLLQQVNAGMKTQAKPRPRKANNTMPAQAGAGRGRTKTAWESHQYFFPFLLLFLLLLSGITTGTPINSHSMCRIM